MSAIVVTPQMLMDTSRAADSQGQFTALYTQWQTSARQSHEAPVGISHLLNTAGIAYDDSENQISRMFTAN